MKHRTGDTAVDGSIMLAMTDLFISATGTMLVVLTLASPDPPKVLPPQADLILTCPQTGDTTDAYSIFSTSAVDFDHKGGTLHDIKNTFPIKTHTDLIQSLSKLPFQSKPMLIIALAPATKRPLTSSCFATASRKILFSYHRENGNSREVALPTLGLQVINFFIQEDFSRER